MKRSMIDVAHLGTVLGISALAAACGGGGSSAGTTASDPAPTAHSLGLMEVTISGLGTRSMTSHAVMRPSGAPVAHAAMPTTVPNGIDVQLASANTNDTDGMRYFTVAYNVRNARFCATAGTCPTYPTASHNLTLVAANTATNINNTAITAIKLFDGSSSDATKALATSLVPTHGMEFNSTTGNGVIVEPGLASLQVYTEAEMAAVARDPGATDLFPYGYVVSNINTAASRSLPASPADNQWDGEVGFSFKIPLQSDPAQDPYSITMIFQVIDDANTRVTESLEEQNPMGDIAATLREVTLGSTDLAVLGGRAAEASTSDPICTVRTAGSAAAPTAYLADNGAVNKGVTVASAPYNLQGQSTSVMHVGFCAPMQVANYANMVISGSQSGPHNGAAGFNTGNYGVSGNIVSFTPNHKFFPGETVSYTLTSGMQSSSGTALAIPFTGSFVAGGVPTVASSGSFSITSTPAVGNTPQGIAEGDFNGDGKLDLAVANVSDNSVTILLNDGSGGFTASTVTAGIGSQPLFISVGDVNGDSKPDLVVSNAVGKSLSILLNNGSGVFTATAASPIGAAPFNTSQPEGNALGDFNGDGKLDIAVADLTDNQVSILLNSGGGNFTQGSTITVGSSPEGIVAGDFNGDGFQDLAVTSLGAGTVTILLNDGSGNFTAASGSPISLPSGATPAFLAVGDFNGDGKPDLAVPDSHNAAVHILMNAGNGQFTLATSVPTSNGAITANVGDYNGDGTLDLAVLNAGGGGLETVSILLNDGTGTFSAGAASTVFLDHSSIPRTMVTGDFDGDGRQDIAVATGLHTSTVSILTGQP